jgi:phosphinothricin acetyltransferase
MPSRSTAVEKVSLHESAIVVDMIRKVDPGRDSERCAEIFAQYIDGPSVFLYEAPTVAEMRATIEQTLATHPWLVAEEDGLVVGYACGSAHRSRPAYRWSAEVSVYIDVRWHRRGAGRALYTALLVDLRERGFHAAFAGVTLPNPASVALHEAMGFTPIGVFHEVGWKSGAWRDVGWWELRLDGRSPLRSDLLSSTVHGM